MRSLPLFGYTPRARYTSWAMALCTMFIVASFSIVGGLRGSMDDLAGNFSSDYYFVTFPGEGDLTFFQTASMGEASTKAAFGVVAMVLTDATDEPVTAFSIDDPSRILPETISTSGNNALAGRDLPLAGEVWLEDGNVTVYVAGRFSSTMFPSQWLLCSRSVMADLTGQESGFNFAVTGALQKPEVAALRSSGFAVQGLIGIVEFLDSGVAEVESDAAWVLVPSSFVIAVLAYGFAAAEASDRRHDIGIMKTLGAGRRRIMSHLLLNGLVLTAWGGLLGLALGVVLSYGVTTAASAMFTSVFSVSVSELLLVVSYAATVGAGLVGTALPAIRMTITSPVDDLKEVARFS